MSDIHVDRAGKQYGPYPLEKAERFYREGRFLPSDFVWKKGLADWMPAPEMFGHLVPASDIAGRPMDDADAMPMPGPGTTAASMARDSTRVSPAPLPPRMHWALALLLSVVTLGIFFVVWMFVQSRWVGKIDPTSNATFQLTGYLLLTLAGEAMGASSSPGLKALGLLVVLGSYVVFYIAMYSMRRSMLNRFAGDGTLGLTLSPALVFLFSVLYLQSRMTRIRRASTGDE